MQSLEFSLELREIILNTTVPLVIRQFPKEWAHVECIEKWCKDYDSGMKKKDIKEKPLFEKMQKMSCQSCPQWERERKLIAISAQEFLSLQNTNTESWYALNYQVANDIPEKCRKGVDFSCFGFPHIAENVRYWLGSRFANTPCHQDTYGVNVVVQMYGSKMWLLLPPDAPLTATRIPYEESSIYCQENFYAPDGEEARALRKLENYVHKCILKAGDVLIVPRKWWHYVEALTLALSVNAWIPLKRDVTAQMEECIVKFLIESYLKTAKDKVVEYVLNPNQISQIASDEILFRTLEHLFKKSKKIKTDPPSKKCGKLYDYMYLRSEQVEELLDKYPTIEKVGKVDASDFRNTLLLNTQRLRKDHVLSPGRFAINVVLKSLINSICCPKVVREIRHEFEKRFEAELA